MLYLILLGLHNMIFLVKNVIQLWEADDTFGRMCSIAVWYGGAVSRLQTVRGRSQKSNKVDANWCCSRPG